MFSLRLQHPFRSKEVFLSAVALHRHKAWGSPAAQASSLARAGHGQCSLHHQPHFLQHCDTALHTKQSLGGQRWQNPCYSKLCWKLHTLKDAQPPACYKTLPSLLRLKAFPSVVIQHKINSEHFRLGQLHFAFSIPGLNDFLLIPSLCVLGWCFYLLLLFK